VDEAGLAGLDVLDVLARYEVVVVSVHYGPSTPRITMRLYASRHSIRR
jgi:hypothetical protein